MSNLFYTGQRYKDWRKVPDGADLRENSVLIDNPSDRQVEAIKRYLLRIRIGFVYVIDNNQMVVKYNIENEIEPSEFFFGLKKLLDNTQIED